MLALRIDQQKLPSRQFEILFNFINITSEQLIEEPLMTEWGSSDPLIDHQKIIDSKEIYLKSEPRSFNYILTSIRVYFRNYVSLNDYIDLRINCTITIEDNFPIIMGLTPTLCFLKDPQDIIKRELDKQAILEDFIELYYILIFLPAIVPLVNSILSLYLEYAIRKRKKFSPRKV